MPDADRTRHLSPARARPGTGRASTSPSSASTRRRSTCASSTSAGRETRVAFPGGRSTCGTPTCPGVGPGQRYGWRVHGPFAPEQGHRFNPNKLLVDPYARALDGAVDLRGPRVRVPARSRTGRPRLRRPGRRGEQAAVRRHRSGVRLGRTTGRLASRGTTRCSTSSTSRASPRLHPHVPEALRGTYLGPRVGRGDPPPRVARRDDRGAHAGARAPRRAGRRGARADELLGLQHARASSRPTGASRPRGGDAVREFKEMVKRLHAAGHRGRPRRRLQPLVRGGRARADGELPRHRQPRLLPPRRRGPAPTTSTTPAAATRSTRPTRRSSSSSPTACATGSRRCTSTASASTSRRPSPAAPMGTSTASARSSRSSTRTRCSRASSSSPSRGTSARAGYQVGNFPDSLVGVERPLPRHGAGLLARRPDGDRAISATASPARAISSPTTAGTRTRASTS